MKGDQPTVINRSGPATFTLSREILEKGQASRGRGTLDA